MLDKTLQWVKVGGQCDWSPEKYPMDSSSLPEFLPDIPVFVSSIFGNAAQTAIVNIYSPGETLAPDRDISESSPAVVVSFARL
ncbi:hypothetical protein B9Z19DRAFT_1080318 [Tuber borchii]|uniref:Uncharacterized protein n=1 Tax=Tuber borchii TaxID=42251 RepID=A0A2T6ZX16_TUBBO|nr:hypothetical protein B9Z19DRAFT_1080318 [Tuber borchii]